MAGPRIAAADTFPPATPFKTANMVTKKPTLLPMAKPRSGLFAQASPCHPDNPLRRQSQGRQQLPDAAGAKDTQAREDQS
jgi:hypothetical protein